MDPDSPWLLTRRRFLIGSCTAAPALGLYPAVAQGQEAGGQGGAAEMAETTLSINGREQRLYLDTRVTLLNALREHLGLTGTKKRAAIAGSAAPAPCWWVAGASTRV